jgi:hypothetical protein
MTINSITTSSSTSVITTSETSLLIPKLSQKATSITNIITSSSPSTTPVTVDSSLKEQDMLVQNSVFKIKESKPLRKESEPSLSFKPASSSSVMMRRANSNVKLSNEVSSFNSGHHSISEQDLWSKYARKMLETYLRKAILSTNITGGKTSTSNLNLNNAKKRNSFSNQFYDCAAEYSITQQQQQNQLSPLKISSSSYSTLKRSNDIKINLSKMLDKKSLEILMNVNGTSIKHNCTHVNKHGVVTSTNSKLNLI